MDALYSNLKQFGAVKVNELLKNHTTFKIGGPARFFVVVRETEKLIDALRFLEGNGIEWYILGGGSNTLANDNGFDGVVICVRTSISAIDADVVEADAGCTTSFIARSAVAAGLTGFEWAVGVPGTIGGAVRGNAGAMGHEIKNSLFEVDVYRNGDIVTLTRIQCAFHYRDSLFKHSTDVILRVRLRLTFGNKEQAAKKMLDVLAYRRETQPKGYASIGCIFKNFKIQSFVDLSSIPREFIKTGKIPAGWLIEQCGMKGATKGDVYVSDVHGNFIVNRGKGTAEDVLFLIEEIKRKVYSTFGIELEEEIQTI